MIDRFVKLKSCDKFVLRSFCSQLLFSLLHLYIEHCSSQEKQIFNFLCFFKSLFYFSKMNGQECLRINIITVL